MGNELGGCDYVERDKFPYWGLIVSTILVFVFLLISFAAWAAREAAAGRLPQPRTQQTTDPDPPCNPPSGQPSNPQSDPSPDSQTDPPSDPPSS